MGRRNHNSIFLAWILVLTTQFGASEARAATDDVTDDISAARAFANQAADAIARGEHAEAENLLRQAYAHYPAPTIAVLHARTLVHLQRLAAATSVYERAALTTLRADSPEAFRRAVELARSEVTELRPRVPRLQVVVRGRALLEPGMRLSLDGRPLSAARQGRWILVDPGRRVIRAELDGATSEQVVKLEEKQSVVIEVSEPPSASSLYKAISWSALGVGVAGIGTGVVTGLLGTSAHSRAVEACPDERCVEGEAGADHLQKFRTYRVVSTVGYAVGAAGLGVGAYLLIRGAMEGPSLRLELDEKSAMLRWQGTL